MSTEAPQQDATQAPKPPVTAIERKPGDGATGMDFNGGENFALLQRVATMLSKSDLVPTRYQGNIPNCIIALNMSQRMGADPLMVMQNLYIVHGNPGWSAKFLTATLNQCGRYQSLRYEWQSEKGKSDWGCRAWTIEKATGERLHGVWVTWQMALDEGWVNKNGSKWKTMPDLMFTYRAATFFVRMYAPELAMGLPTTDELRDVIDLNPGDFREVPNGEDPEPPDADVKPNGAAKEASLADQLKAKRESRPPAPTSPITPAETKGFTKPPTEQPPTDQEPVAESLPSTEEPKQAESAGDGGMGAEDALRADVEAVFERCLNTQGKKRQAMSKLQTAFSVANVTEIPANKLSAALDLFTALLEG